MRPWVMGMIPFSSQASKQVYAFDIQEQALEKTQERLDQAGMKNAQLILKGHETLDQFVTEAKAGILILVIYLLLTNPSSLNLRLLSKH